MATYVAYTDVKHLILDKNIPAEKSQIDPCAGMTTNKVSYPSERDFVSEENMNLWTANSLGSFLTAVGTAKNGKSCNLKTVKFTNGICWVGYTITDDKNNYTVKVNNVHLGNIYVVPSAKTGVTYNIYMHISIGSINNNEFTYSHLSDRLFVEIGKNLTSNSSISTIKAIKDNKKLWKVYYYGGNGELTRLDLSERETAIRNEINNGGTSPTGTSTSSSSSSSSSTSTNSTSYSDDSANSTDSSGEGTTEITDEFEMETSYAELLEKADAADDYWTKISSKYGIYSVKSMNSIIGLPLHFLPNVDTHPGSSTFGKQYLENIMYDMNLGIIKVGGPVLSPKYDSSESALAPLEKVRTMATKAMTNVERILKAANDGGMIGAFGNFLYLLMKNGNARFYTFESDYTHYTHYVNTLCHLFVTFLGIGDKYYTNGQGIKEKYVNYEIALNKVESDTGSGMMTLFGYDSAVYLYYSPESQLTHSFQNSTKPSALQDTVDTAVNSVKEFQFFLNAAGIESGKQVVNLDGIANANVDRSGILGRLFGNLTEGVATVFAGNRLSLPEIYDDSDTTVQHTFNIKLSSPYGDPESVFLYVLEPLSRLLAFALPRQYGPNSYTSPFIVQAFSKGQFNCQLGIVESLTITRGGSSGTSETIHHIPTELNISMTITDMYEKVFLSNEYHGANNIISYIGYSVSKAIDTRLKDDDQKATMLFGSLQSYKAAKLLFNNIGLIDFVASFTGYNLNQPSYSDSWSLFSNLIKNRSKEFSIQYINDKWTMPYYHKGLVDSTHTAISNTYSFTIGG